MSRAPWIAALALAAATPAAAQPVSGEAVFAKWCAPCHAPGPNHPGTQSLEAKYKGSRPGELQARTDLTADQVKLFVRHGVSIMPFFRKTEITDPELDALANYLAHQRR